MNDIVIETRDLTKEYRDFWGKRKVLALDHLSLDVRRGEVFGFLGPNGSGKTTTVKLLLGLLFPTSGVAEVLGQKPGSVAANQRIGFLPEESYLYRFLNAEETLDFYGRLFRHPTVERRRRIDFLIEKVGLDEARERQFKEYSKGMARRIGLAQALINDPEIVFLDEPTSGLDPIGTREIKDLIIDLKNQGKTVFMCSHLLADVEDVCDRIAILFRGKLEVVGRVSELLTEESVVNFRAQNVTPATREKVRQALEDDGSYIGIGKAKRSLEGSLPQGRARQHRREPRGRSGREALRERGESPVMHSILAIALVTLKDALRKKVLFTILLFAVLLTVTSGLLPYVGPDDRIRQVAKVALTGIGFFGMIVAIFLSAPSLPDDISKKTIFTVMTKPARRWEIIAGKITGLGMVLALILVVMGTLSYGYVRVVAGRLGPTDAGMPRLQGNAPHYAGAVDYNNLRLEISQPMIESHRAIASGFDRVVYHFSGLDKMRYAGDTVFAQITVFSHSWAYDPTTGEGTASIEITNPSTGDARQIVFGANNDRPVYLGFPRTMIDANGRLDIVLSRHLPSGSYSATASSAAILSQPSTFTMNFLKAMVMMFMQYMVLVFIAVSASTILTSTVSIIFALFVYFTGSLTGILRGQALALGREQNIFTMAQHTHETTHPAIVGYEWVVNVVLRYFYLGISVVFPNLSFYDPSDSISDNQYIPWSAVWHGFWYAAVFSAAAFLVAWLIFRRKEVA